MQLKWLLPEDFNNGQSCIASKRFIAVAAVADEFWKSLPIK
jgi:acyl-CoA reductase-like NAD-dependent aldehyde dehydrogenase